jgi:hypothetical protein
VWLDFVIASLGQDTSLARPGGNVTGLSQQLTREIRAKQLQLLKQALPKMSRVAVLHSAATTVGDRTSSPERQRAVGHPLGGGGRLCVRELGTGLLMASRRGCVSGNHWIGHPRELAIKARSLSQSLPAVLLGSGLVRFVLMQSAIPNRIG